MDFWHRYITARIPLQSPVGSEEPTGDSFSPGEAMGALPRQCIFHYIASHQKIPPVPKNRGVFALWGEELLLQGLSNSNGHGDCHADHGVVAAPRKPDLLQNKKHIARKRYVVRSLCNVKHGRRAEFLIN